MPFWVLECSFAVGKLFLISSLLLNVAADFPDGLSPELATYSPWEFLRESDKLLSSHLLNTNT
jgi:hypothetical protein